MEQTPSASDTFSEGTDYFLFQRVRLLDKMGFTQPQEAYSLVLPKGWTHQGEIVWNMPGTSCSGTFRWLKAKSADGKYSLEMFPDLVYSWNSDPQLQQFNQAYSDAKSNCRVGQPMNAEAYLRNVFAQESLNNPQITNITANPIVVEQMQQANQKTMQELRSYGAGQMQFDQTAINADVSWSDGTEGLVILGMNVLETMVPNAYTGGATSIYTSQASNRLVFKYPKGESEQAKNLFSVIMSGFRTNTAWQNAVSQYWKAVRENRQVVHVGKIELMDAQTRAIGKQAIQNGANRLAEMDNQMRSWEAQQNSQDRMHTNFIKTIREVDNYQDASGKVELSSGYNHAWSRGDGSTFIMSNNSSFNPSSVFQDQNWTEMKKVD